MSEEFDPKIAEHQSFTCAQCGAQMEWDASKKMLACAFCGHEQDPEQAGEIKEYDLDEFLRSGTGKEQGYGLVTKSVQCQSCGATTAMEPNVTSTECPFCGSNVILEQETSADIIQPESLVPFQISEDVAHRKYREWLGSGLSRFFRPGDLQKRAGQSRIYGVYLPFWTFDADAFSRWRAEAGHYYYETETYYETDDEGKRVQKTRQVRKTRWEPAWGQHSGSYDDELVYGTESVDIKILQKIYPYNTKELVPYAPEYLSGWRAEQYQIDVRGAWKIGTSIIEGKEESACISQIPGDTYRNLHVNTTISDVTFKHTLLPVWIASYPYGGKTYRYMINGQTGKVEGERPISWIRVAAAVVIVIVIIVVLVLLFGGGGNGTEAEGLLRLWGLV